MTSSYLLSARLDTLVERLTAYGLPTSTTLALEAAAGYLAEAASKKGKRNKVLTELFWSGKHGKELSPDGKKRAIQDLKDRGSVHETKGGKLKLTKQGVEEFAAISKKKAELVEKGVRRFAGVDLNDAKRAIRASLQATLAIQAYERIANPPTAPIYDDVYFDGVVALDDLDAAVVSAAGDRDSAVVVTIPIPDKYARRFPDPVTANHGYAPHLTLLFVGNKEYQPGELSTITSLLRAACRKVPPFRLYVDPNSGLQDFGPNEEQGEKALWLPARAEPRGEVERLYRMMRLVLEQEGVEVGAHDSFKPHVTWAYVPNDQAEQDRHRMNAAVADRFKDGFYFDVRHVMLTMPDGTTKTLALSPIPRKT